MNLKSIQFKLGLVIFLSGLFLIITIVVYTAITARNNAIQAAEEQFQTLAREYAAKIKAEIEIPMNSVKTLAQSFSAVKNPDSPLHIGRYPANAILQTILKYNRDFLAIYTLWESNAFDQMDEKYKDIAGQDTTGRFMPYWTRNSKGDIVLDTLKDYDNEGVGDYYLVPRRNLNEAVIGPYFKTVQGEKKLIISIVAPIIYNDIFYGIVGADISLEWLQAMVDKNYQKNQKIKIIIISNNSIIAAAYKQDYLIGKNAKEIYEDFNEKLSNIEEGKEIIKFKKNNLELITPLKIGKTFKPWAVNVIIPAEIIVEDATIQMWKNFFMSASISFLALLIIIFFIRRMIKPLGKIAEIAEKVALGDLSYQEIETHYDEIGKVNAIFKKVVNSLSEITSVCEATAVGDFSKKVEIRSEKDVLGISVNQMAENLRAVVEQANNIAKGDYSREIKPKSDQDELGNALYKMTTALRNMAHENEKQNLLKSQRMELNERMRGEQDMPTLTKNIVSYLCHCMNSNIGAFYVIDDENNIFRLTGSYAYQTRKNLSNAFKKGEGLVGQAVLEKEYIELKNCPEDYILISSGLGQSVPKNILVFPFIIDEFVNSVVEIGSFNEFSKINLIFLEQVSESIAIAINSCVSRTRMENLLRQTQQQAELLQTQQEELRQTNEELEEQAKALKKSEAKLQEQQEELRQANEELQEQTNLLKEQKEDIQKKNQELKNARKTIEEKAHDLELTSQYKSEFLANMSHELRTPLNSVLLLSKMLVDNKEKNLTPKQIEFTQTIHSAGADLLNLINEILDLSKVESGKMVLNIENVNLKDVIDNMKKYFKPTAQQKGLQFIVDASDDMPLQIKTDQHRLEQILKNFFSNSFKFTSKGNITFKIYKPKNEITSNIISGELPVEYSVAFTVSDSGIGIPKHKQKIIFEAFQQADGTTSRKYGGTGLGLSISRELAKLLGGTIFLESEENKGSSFTIYLPESINKKDKEIKQPKNEINLQPIDSQEKKSVEKDNESPVDIIKISDDKDNIKADDKSILIIEDDPAFYKVLCDISREKGFKVLIATDGETGLKYATDYQPSAILLDVGLPNMSGWSVMSHLKEMTETRHIPVHFISASDRTGDALKMGAIGYLTKPVSMEKLNQAYEKIENIISRRIKRLLLVENDEIQRKAVIELLGNGDLIIDSASNGLDGYNLIKSNNYDCMILDISLPDISGIELLTKIKNDALINIPVIIYTGKELNRKEQLIIEEYAEKVIIKDVRSPEKLLDDTSLFLHRVEANMPYDKRQILKTLHNKESIFKDKKVLLADDDMRNVFALSSIMEEKGLQVFVSKNGLEAVSCIEKNPDINLILMDIMMPEMDGYEAIKTIRKQKRFAKLPIISLTAKAMKGDRAKCIEAGANDYLTKPIDPDKLLAMLKVWLYQ